MCSLLSLTNSSVFRFKCKPILKICKVYILTGILGAKRVWIFLFLRPITAVICDVSCLMLGQVSKYREIWNPRHGEDELENNKRCGI